MTHDSCATLRASSAEVASTGSPAELTCKQRQGSTGSRGSAGSGGRARAGVRRLGSGFAGEAAVEA